MRAALSERRYALVLSTTMSSVQEDFMSKISSEKSGVVGGAIDVSGDTTVDLPSEVLDDALARRHEAEERGRFASKRSRAAQARAKVPAKKPATP